jgi:hypothetical protein
MSVKSGAGESEHYRPAWGAGGQQQGAEQGRWTHLYLGRSYSGQGKQPKTISGEGRPRPVSKYSRHLLP